MKTAISLFAALALATTGLVGCAGDTSEPTPESSGQGEGSSEADLNAGACQSRASFMAHWQRLCPGRAVCTSYNTTYNDHGHTKQCPGAGATSATCHCR